MPIIPINDDTHWHDLRRTHIGASEIAALFSCKSFTTAHEIWTRMRGLYSATHENDFLEFGNDMEPIVAKYLARTYGLEIVKAQEYHEHPQYPWLGCTPDYYIANSEHGKAGLQIKHVSSEFVPGWNKFQEKAPEYIEIQVAQELMIQAATLEEYGYEPITRHYIGAMMGGNVSDLILWPRLRRPDLEEEIIEKSAAFMELVARAEPPVDDPRDLEHLRDMFAQSRLFDDRLDIRDKADEVARDAEAYFAAQKEEAAARERKLRYKARLLRHSMIFDEAEVLGHTIAETDEYEIHTRVGEVRYKAKEESVSEQVRFDVKRKKVKK